MQKNLPEKLDYPKVKTELNVESVFDNLLIYYENVWNIIKKLLNNPRS